MIWTRREFLKTVLAGAVAAAVAPVAVHELESFFQPTFPPFDPTKAFSVYEILARPVNSKKPLKLQIERENGSVILQVGVYPQGGFRWVAVPGNELVDPAKDGYRIVNGSDADLEVVMCIKQGNEHYQFQGSEYTHIGYLPIEHDEEEEEVFEA